MLVKKAFKFKYVIAFSLFCRGKSLYIVNPNLGDKLVSSNTDNILDSSENKSAGNKVFVYASFVIFQLISTVCLIYKRCLSYSQLVYIKFSLYCRFLLIIYFVVFHFTSLFTICPFVKDFEIARLIKANHFKLQQLFYGVQ